MSYLEIAVAIYTSYLIGSLSSAIITCHLMGLPDPRSQGSKNPGATNVLRIGGKKAALITLLGDTLKGVIPVLAAKYWGFNDAVVAGIAFAAFLGHLWPIYYKFEGGKGVATALGIMIALSPVVAAIWGVTWLLMAVIFRYSSLAALTAIFIAPIAMWFCTHNWPFTYLMIAIIPFIFWRHQKNIRQLIAGNEKKIGQK